MAWYDTSPRSVLLFPFLVGVDCNWDAFDTVGEGPTTICGSALDVEGTAAPGSSGINSTIVGPVQGAEIRDQRSDSVSPFKWSIR